MLLVLSACAQRIDVAPTIADPDLTYDPVRAGEEFSLDNVWVKRPGTGGILANDLNKVLGKKALRDLEADSQVSPEVVEN